MELRTDSVSLFIVFLMQFSGAASELICSHQPIVALVGEDVLLPCHLEPAVSASDEKVVWTRPDLIPEYIHYHQDGRLLFKKQNPSYYSRTRLFMDELPRGNVSMQIFKVKISDAGRYNCKLPSMVKETPVQLIVGAVSTPFIEVVTNNSEHAVLQCNSTGWYPEPEVFWLDGEGNLLSAGPTETVRGPDDLYTVSSRVTVEKRHSNSFTCRVQQNHTNQTRETLIHVPDDFFEVQSSSSSTTVGLAVSLAVCILVILILGFFVWRQKKTKAERSHRDETDEGEKNQESEVLMTEMMGSKDETIKKLLQERRDKEKAQSEVMRLNHHLESKDKELDGLKDEVNKLTEEKKRSEEERQKLEQKLQDEKKKSERDQRELKEEQKRNTELEKKLSDLQQLHEEKKKKEEKSFSRSLFNSQSGSKDETIRKERRDKEKAQSEVMKLKHHLESKDKEKQNSSSLSQNSTTEPDVVVEVDQYGKYIKLINKSSEDQQLGGWTLKIQVSDNKPVIHTFEDSFNLKTGQALTVWCHVHGRNAPPADLVLKDLKSWSYTDNPQVSLICNTGEINLARI